MRRTVFISVLLGLAVVGSASAVEAAPAKRTDAEAHFEAAAELYAREDYAEAAREFSIAYALDPRVDTLFAWAQAERLAKHDEEALELYERLLAGKLSNQQREAIEGLRDEVVGQLAIARAQAQAQPEPEPEPIAQPSTDASSAREDPGSGRGGKLALTGVGAGLTVLGGALLIGAAVADGRVRAAQTYSDFDAAFDPKTGRGRGAVALYASGGLLAAAGLATLIAGAIQLARTKDSRESRRARTFVVMPSLGRDQLGVMLTIGSGR